ncbi:GNAT family N-acetyltransferase [Cellulomonas sp. zg-ZUI22]|uniref:GNAT family N-acetyltransferase n=1 Tax=Cellulomonas sp. zg-ZUI22 TaxID=2816955 RepID=UPI001A94514F|nr:GNAT family N-acetyltransferase [Cellulomonas sp. zg-ZUI22]MBO0901590.1 GNAT family N-acetyltransferase [Cellulomonas sp. zg-ZUI22]
MTETVVHRVWAERLGVAPAVFRESQPVFVDRSDLTAAVVVRLGRTVAVAAPERALSRLRSLGPGHLLHVGSLLGALEPWAPRLFGVASLAFADHTTLAPVGADAARTASEAEVEAVLSRCSVEERDESGLLDMDPRWVALGEDGEPAGAAGYEVWGGGLAHVGVAVAAASRGKGLGARAAMAAAVHAIGVGLVPQWRCREDNVASLRVGERLGFVRTGEQVAIDLAPDERDLTHAAR